MRNPIPGRTATKRTRSFLSLLLCTLFLTMFCSVPVKGADPEEQAPPEESAVLPEEEPSQVPPEEIPAEEGIPGEVSEEALEQTEEAPQTARTDRENRQVGDLLDTSNHIAYINGYKSGVFKPNSYVTRAEAAQMFYTLLRSKDWDRKSFPDVQGQWYTDAVETMAGLDILQGYSDGKFKAARNITRAEFVKLAVSFDSLSPGTNSFSDVPEDSWAAPYIASAAEKGWVNGFANGTFRPNDKVTRAQAVAILNRMLGRTADPYIEQKTDVKNFYDIFPDTWFYGDVMEAATTHGFYTSGGSEYWSSYERDSTPQREGGWFQEGNTSYYLDQTTQKVLRGKQVIDGATFLFDEETGAALTGFRTIGGWRKYYKNGRIVDDLADLNVTKPPYLIKVYKNSNYLIVFASDGKGNFNTPVTAMRASCGYGTITGTYYTPDKYRWLCMIGDTWAQWCTQIEGNYLFHSVPNWTQSNMDLEVDEYNHLGDTRSLGCIRLNCKNAKWIYDNCPLGTKVFITTAEASGPLPKPAGLAPLPYWHTWDPTDPTAYWRCRENGCH